MTDVQMAIAQSKSRARQIGAIRYRYCALRGRRTGAQQLVGDGVDQGLEAGVDDVGGDADREPALARALVAAFHQHARDGLGAAREDAHLVVDQLDVLDVALVAAQVLAQREIVPTNRKVTTALNKVPVLILDPKVLIDQQEKWSKLYDELFLRQR